MSDITVFEAKRIITMDPGRPTASAVAVRDGRILSVGTRETMRPWLDRYPHTVDKTFADRILLRNKVVGFIVTGGQDNVQGVVGQLMTFFGELGCQFPQFPFIAHSRGWSAEDMENNMRVVQHSTELHSGARGLVDRCIDTCRALLGVRIGAEKPVRGGRKAHRTEG